MLSITITVGKHLLGKIKLNSFTGRDVEESARSRCDAGGMSVKPGAPNVEDAASSAIGSAILMAMNVD